MRCECDPSPSAFPLQDLHRQEDLMLIRFNLGAPACSGLHLFLNANDRGETLQEFSSALMRLKSAPFKPCPRTDGISNSDCLLRDQCGAHRLIQIPSPERQATSSAAQPSVTILLTASSCLAMAWDEHDMHNAIESSRRLGPSLFCITLVVSRNYVTAGRPERWLRWSACLQVY
ncbi:unnamed protein product [Pleuronectes platessa]|uniref:Uncharacterized protein n=1 Tax=Pleuronectes platessa TaxID=8262 RepID=A0A9N7UNE1_PLEPL|nr:unnamed protein product [Pleuronectes platessa]